MLRIVDSADHWDDRINDTQSSMLLSTRLFKRSEVSLKVLRQKNVRLFPSFTESPASECSFVLHPVRPPSDKWSASTNHRIPTLSASLFLDWEKKSKMITTFMTRFIASHAPGPLFQTQSCFPQDLRRNCCKHAKNKNASSALSIFFEGHDLLFDLVGLTVACSWGVVRLVLKKFSFTLFQMPTIDSWLHHQSWFLTICWRVARAWGFARKTL